MSDCARLCERVLAALSCRTGFGMLPCWEDSDGLSDNPDAALAYGSGVVFSPLTGNGLDPPGREGRCVRRLFRYCASQSFCEGAWLSCLGGEPEVKNLRAEERLLGPFEFRWRVSVEVMSRSYSAPNALQQHR